MAQQTARTTARASLASSSAAAAWLRLVAGWAVVSTISLLPFSTWDWRNGYLPFIWWALAAVCAFFMGFALTNSRRTDPLKGLPVPWSAIILGLTAMVGLALGWTWG